MNNKWDKIEDSDRTAEKIWSAKTTYAADVFRKLRSDKLAMGGILFILFLGVFAIFGPMISPYSYEEQNRSYIKVPPNMQVVDVSGKYYYITENLRLLEVGADGTLGELIKYTKEDTKNKKNEYMLEGKTYAMSIRRPYVFTDEDGNSFGDTKTIWNKNYVLGSDELGRDILVRLMYGARISMLIALIAASVNLIIGIIYGGISGYFGGTVDSVMMRIVDIISTIPLTLYVILIMVVFESGLKSIIIALSSVYWVDMARIVRGQTLSIKEQEYVQAAKTIGTSTFGILRKHIIPNAMGSIVVTVTMLIPTAIFIESFMSFIGIGVSAPMASWGTLCSQATQHMKAAPYLMIWPTLAICLTMFAFSFLGDGLRAALDPKMRK